MEIPTSGFSAAAGAAPPQAVRIRLASITTANSFEIRFFDISSP
jgi:hypothetical protein